jgi:hypothetical protein
MSTDPADIYFDGEDIYIEPDPAKVAMFDYLSIHAVITSPSVKHAAHGLPYSEYRKHRSRSTDTDKDEKNSRVCFYTDPVLGMLLRSLARRREVSLYGYINDMLEEGQIHFHPEYHEQYEEVNDILDDMQKIMSNDAQSRAVLKLRNQTIGFGVCTKGAPRFVPRVAYWLCEDIKTVSLDLHMTISDTAYLYIIVGILYTDAPEMPLTPYQDKKLSEVLTIFGQELNSMLDICRHIAENYETLV